MRTFLGVLALIGAAGALYAAVMVKRWLRNRQIPQWYLELTTLNPNPEEMEWRHQAVLGGLGLILGITGYYLVTGPG